MTVGRAGKHHVCKKLVRAPGIRALDNGELKSNVLRPGICTREKAVLTDTAFLDVHLNNSIGLVGNKIELFSCGVKVKVHVAVSCMFCFSAAKGNWTRWPPGLVILSMSFPRCGSSI